MRPSAPSLDRGTVKDRVGTGGMLLWKGEPRGDFSKPGRAFMLALVALGNDLWQ